jgi:hypothetical protein
MYCPKCGHHAGSNNVRFCPGCGIWLQGVAEWVVNDGLLAPRAETAPKPRRSMVKRGALLGATLMFIPLLALLPIVRHGPWENGPTAFFFTWVTLMALIGVSSYLKRMITNIFNVFSEEEPAPSKIIASPRSQPLPATYIAPVADSGRQYIDTTKMGQPSSVADQTTSRLNKA